MAKQSPNKRKSDGSAIGTPKKQKLDGENVKTPIITPKSPTKINTPKSAKINNPKSPKNINPKSPKNNPNTPKNNTPKLVKNNNPNSPKTNPKSPKNANPNSPKTNPKSPKNNDPKSPKPKNPNSAQINTPKSGKKNLPGNANTPNGVNKKTPNPAIHPKSPGSAKKNKQSPNSPATTSPKKLKKFAGTSEEGENQQVKLVRPDAPGMNLVKRPKNENATTDAPDTSPLSKAGRRRMRKAIEAKANGVEVKKVDKLTNASVTKKRDKRERQAVINVVATENHLGLAAQKRLKSKLKKQAKIQEKKEMAIASGAKPVVKTLNENQLAKNAVKKQRMIEKLGKRSPAPQQLQKNKPKNNKGPFKKQQPKIEAANDSKDEESDLNDDDAVLESNSEGDVESNAEGDVESDPEGDVESDPEGDVESDSKGDVELDSDEELNSEEVTGDSETLDATEEDENESDESSSEAELEIQGKNESAIKERSVKDGDDVSVPKKQDSSLVIYVGRLPFHITKGQLFEHFKDTCVIKYIRIPKDRITKKTRGFAFLQMPNKKEYYKALTLHRSILHTRQISVEVYKPLVDNRRPVNYYKPQTMRRPNFKKQAVNKEPAVNENPE